MELEQHWTVTVAGTVSAAPDANAAVDILVAVVRRQVGLQPIRWRIDAVGSAGLFGCVAAGNAYDGWYAFWADSIRQQLNSSPDGV